MNEKSYKAFFDAGYILFRFKKICLLTHYNNSRLKPYIEDLIEILLDVCGALLILVLFPVRLIMILYTFIPKFKYIK